MVLRATGWTIAIVLGAGCGEQALDTCGRETKELSAVAIVVDRGDEVRAEVDFAAGDRALGPDALQVCEDEQLRINGRAPTETPKDDRIIYSANLDADARTVTFALTRDSGVVSLTVDLPDPFEILAPQAGDELSRAADATVAWEPAAGEAATMRIELGEEIGGGVCLYTETGDHDYKGRGGVDVPDQGSWTVPAGSILSEPDGPCGAHYTLRRIAPGEYPEALDPGGHIEGRVERIVAFSSVP